jgi:hypothetical protein
MGHLSICWLGGGLWLCLNIEEAKCENLTTSEMTAGRAKAKAKDKSKDKGKSKRQKQRQRQKQKTKAKTKADPPPAAKDDN